MKIKSLKSSCKLTAALAMFGSILLTGANSWATGSSSLVIAEVYGGGGNNGATYKNDFIVVFNRSASSVNVNGWSVQYASAAGTTWAVTPLATSSKIIPAGGYFLVQETNGTGGTVDLPTPDMAGVIAMSATAGKVALCNSTTALSVANPVGGATVVDFVGFGNTATGFEGPVGPPGSQAPTLSNTTSDQRVNSGCQDTDVNTNDFVAGAPNPRNSASATHSCVVVLPPVISDLSPASLTTTLGATAAFTVTLSQGDAPLYYFWYKETGSATNLAFYATNNATLTLANIAASDVASYQVVVSNASTLTATSAVATLTVVDPAITLEPVSQPGLLGGTVQFPMVAAGTGLSYQWYRFDGVATYASVGNGLQGSGSTVSGATTSTLLFSNLHNADATNFVVVVTGTFGAVTSSVVSLTVANTAPLALWNFNGGANPAVGGFNTINFNNPAPYQGIGTAAAVNCEPFIQSTPANVDYGGDVNDPLTSTNFSWGTDNYPAQATSNKLAGAQFNVSTLGAKNIIVTFDTRGTSTASKYERLQFTTNGTDFIDYPTSATFAVGNVGTYELRGFSLAGFPGTRNNPNFGIRIVTEYESTAQYGATNNDNFVGITATYAPGGTVSYDIVNVTASAITNANIPPTITSIPDQTVEDTFGSNVNFTVSDTETPAGSLNVTAVSLNPATSVGLAVNNLGGGSRQLVFSSNLGNSANVNVPILVTVTDGNGDSTVTWFTLTITPANAPPVITGLVTTNMIGNGTLVIPFTLTDDHTAPATITPTVVSGNTTLVANDITSLALGGNGTSRILTIKPGTNQLGTVPITVTASDGSKSASYSFALVVRPSTNVVLNDYFTYDGSGYIVSQSGGFWQHHSGTGSQVQTGPGAVFITGLNSEDVNAPLIDAPYQTNNPAVGPAVLYSKMQLTFTALPTLNGAYFAHFKDNTTFGFLGRLWASTLNAVDGKFRIGIGNSSATTNSTSQFPLDLDLNTTYIVVTRLVLSNAVSTLWINPASESDAHVTDNTLVTTNMANIYAYALRQSTGEGDVSISNLVVSTSFNDAVGIAALDIKLAATNAVLTWSNPMFGLQCATNVAGPYVTIGGATSPYTNAVATSTTRFYRLVR